MIANQIGKVLDKLDFLLRSEWHDDYRTFLDIPEARKYVVESLQIKEGEQILDVGDYTGRNLPNMTHYPEQGHVTVLIQNRVAKANASSFERSNKAAIQYAKGKETKLPFPDNSFDKVLLTYVFSANAQATEKVMQDAVRVTKPQGLIGVLDHRWANTFSYVNILENISFSTLKSIRDIGWREAVEELLRGHNEHFCGDGLAIEWSNSFPYLEKMDTHVFAKGGKDLYDGVRLRSHLLKLHYTH